MIRLICLFGAVYGALLGIGFGVSYMVIGTAPEDYTKGEVVGYSVMIASSITIYFAIRAVSRKPENQPIGFWKGFWVGTSVSAIGAFLFGIYNLAYINYLHPTFIAEYMAFQEQQIRYSGATQQQITLQLEELSQYAQLMENDMLYAGVMFATVFIIGLVFTVVTAASIKQTTMQSE